MKYFNIRSIRRPAFKAGALALVAASLVACGGGGGGGGAAPEAVVSSVASKEVLRPSSVPVDMEFVVTLNQ